MGFFCLAFPHNPLKYTLTDTIIHFQNTWNLWQTITFTRLTSQYWLKYCSYQVWPLAQPITTHFFDLPQCLHSISFIFSYLFNVFIYYSVFTFLIVFSVCFASLRCVSVTAFRKWCIVLFTPSGVFCFSVVFFCFSTSFLVV